MVMSVQVMGDWKRECDVLAVVDAVSIVFWPVVDVVICVVVCCVLREMTVEYLPGCHASPDM